ncbi:cysteine protease ATG4D [Galendromus occidentalis]|uniref:Cysteine protease n=1 Tax=Galendromus occidentalis TaxID=34638 RepID=A0AAJ6VYK5_9ACAR|nr:cysteine protease ATG4D [Galendromus occidentalis]
MAAMTDAYMSFLQGINSRSFPRIKLRSSSAQASSCLNDSLQHRCHSQESFVDLGEENQDVFRRSTSLPSLDQVDGYLSNSLSPGQGQESTSEAVKNRVRGWWANMKYGWNAMNSGAQIDISDLSGADPIYLLGHVYHNKNNSASFKNFFADFSTRLWFTYRQDFQPMQSTGHTSDSGWGCMLRSAQMMLAEAFIFHLLGRQWRWCPQQQQQEHGVHRKIIKWFSDDPDTTEAPFSVHNMVRAAAHCGKKAGDWFGPSTAAYLLKRCLEEAAGVADSKEIFEQMAIYVAQDCTIYTQDVLDLCTSDPNIEWKSVVLLIPVRLGGERVNVNYIHCIKEILAYQNCLGIIGGKPRHSLYFVGFQGKKLVYLDPHYLQKTTDTSRLNFSVNSFHCTTARKVSFSKLDPSATIGFYCKTRRDFESFQSIMQSVTESCPQNQGYPVFIISEGSSALVNQLNPLETSQERILRVHRNIITPQGTVRRESEEYVVL